MSRHIQQGYNQTTDPIWRLRWFLVYLYAFALILSIIAAVVIAIITKNVLPSLVPGGLLLAMKPIVKWAFSQHEEVPQPIPMPVNHLRQKTNQGV